MSGKVAKRYIRQGKCNRCGWCCLQEDQPCPYLVKEKDGTYTCSVYDDKSKRFERCYLYPSNPPIMNEECGYLFWDLFENKYVKKIL